MEWHLDVAVTFPKSVGTLIGGSAHTYKGLVYKSSHKIFTNTQLMNAALRFILIYQWQSIKL